MDKFKTLLLNDSRLHILLIAVLVFSVYAGILNSGFTGSDDKTLFTLVKIKTEQGKTFNDIVFAPYMFDEGYFFRPVVTASFYLTGIGSSLNIHFLVNILIHAVCAVLLYLIFVKLNTGKLFSFLLAALFTVNPVTVNAVAWLPGRNDTLAAMFILASFLIFLEYLNRKKIYLLVLNSILLLLAFLSKETALLAAPLFIAYSIMSSKNKKSDYTPIIFWIAVALVWYFIRSAFISQNADAVFMENILYPVYAVGSIILPFSSGVLPVMKDMPLLTGIAALVITAGIYFAVPANRKKYYWAGLIIFVVFLIPSVINHNPEYTGNIMLESRLYLPAIGIFLLLASVYLSFQNKSDLLYYSASFAIICAVFIFLTVTNCRNYESEPAFWNNAVNTSPSLDLSFSGRGLYLLQSGRFEESLLDYKRAIELNPERTDYYSKAAYCSLNLNNSDEAEQYYRKYTGRNPNDAEACMLLGILCFKKQNYNDAEKFLITSLKNNPANNQSLLYLARVYYAKGDFAAAKSQAESLKNKNVKLTDELEKLLSK